MELVTRQLAEFIVGFELAQLPDRLLTKLKLHILDTFGAVIGGSREDASKIVFRVVSPMGGTGEATAIGHGNRLPAMSAGLVNGTSAHCLELDDGGAATHPGSCVVPAAFAVAQRNRSFGRQFVEAVLVGYETTLRIGRATFPHLRRRGFHPTSACGSFGAAAAAGRLMGLNAETMASALGLAGTQTCGLREGMGSGSAMMKRLHPGKAAQNGILAALLASEGYKGADTILEGQNGFLKLFAQDYDLSQLTAGLSASYFFEFSEIKPHSCCRHLHAPIDSLLKLTDERRLRPDTVERITVKTYREGAYYTNPFPQSFGEAQFSMPFCLALAMNEGQVLPVDIRNNLRSSRVLDLAKRVDITFDVAMDEQYVQNQNRMRPHILEITLKNGEVLRNRTDYPKGSPPNPMTTEEMEKKFLGLAQSAIDSQEAIELMEALREVDSLGDVNELADLMP